MATNSPKKAWYTNSFLLALYPCALFRFVLFAPFGYYWAHASTHWNVIKNHIELSSGLYNPAIAAGEKIASNWGTFAFYWNFAVWIPSLWFPPPLNLPFTVTDTVTAIYLSRATHYQTSYAPHSKGACAEAAYTWHRPAGVNESFFEAASRLNATVTTAPHMCRSFAEEWQFGVALSFFYALISAFNIVAFFGSLLQAKKQNESLKDVVLTLFKKTLECVLNIPKVLALLVVGILYYLPEIFFRCMPLSFKANVRVGRRSAFKGALGLEQKAELGAVQLKEMYKQSRKSPYVRYEDSRGEPSPLSEFLGTYDMLIAVARILHYSDIIHLSRVSKSVRESVLPAHDFERRLKTFERYTCPRTRHRCWICDKQICSGCQQLPLIPRTTTIHHLWCRPSCKQCFQHVVRRRPAPSERVKPPYCACAPITAQPPNIVMRWFRGSNYYTNSQSGLQKLTLAVCRECNLNSKQTPYT
ncbi:hypothetical protein CC86DRAFT_37335 [Ophiobolus disseminans]|uniref:Uncharacterized protein n=1 Tax=Ophiobolus disseminans TaxID=1469910 RepID=A0A6A6ZZP1_9PLEO|nr:hypothetical protein CC86DRAFT_37335 [Ophiobolus disseminans]